MTGTVSGACRLLDLDFDGDYDSTDAAKFDALDQGLAYKPGMTSSAVDQPFAHQGLLYEPEISSYQNRARQYNPRLMRFLQVDPIGISGGVNAYGYVKSNPMAYVDPTGNAATAIWVAIIGAAALVVSAAIHAYGQWKASGCQVGDYHSTYFVTQNGCEHIHVSVCQNGGFYPNYWSNRQLSSCEPLE